LKLKTRRQKSCYRNWKKWNKVLNEGSEQPVAMELKNFKGILTKEQGKELQKHIQMLRNEWGG
jgi:hypothetical protein